MQIAIDGIKKEYVVDPNEDIARIRKQPCMNREKDFPLFIKYTRKVPVTKNGKDRQSADIKKDKQKRDKRIDENIICPMNWLQERLDKIQGIPYKHYSTDTLEFVMKPTGYADNRQMTKIRKLVDEYDRYSTYCLINMDEETGVEMYAIKTNEVIEKLKSMSISRNTMIRLINTSLGYVGNTKKKYVYRKATEQTRRMMSLLYRYDKKKFLSCFTDD